MKGKNPWIAAILNFFLPGIGFVYLGTPILIIGGILYFILGGLIGFGVTLIFLKCRCDVGIAEALLVMFFSVLAELLFAVITFGVTQIYNRSLQALSGKPS